MPNVEATSNETPAAVADQGATVAPLRAASKKGASPQKGVFKGHKTARGSRKSAPKKEAKAVKKGARPVKDANAPRAERKGAKILELISRPKGVTLAEIMKATDWQAHSVRGFLSTAGKKRGINIESVKNDAGDRVYQIKR
jgi:hypothetical protein